IAVRAMTCEQVRSMEKPSQSNPCNNVPHSWGGRLSPPPALGERGHRGLARRAAAAKNAANFFRSSARAGGGQTGYVEGKNLAIAIPTTTEMNRAASR